MNAHVSELTELERIVLRKALDAYAARVISFSAQPWDKSNHGIECTIARDLSLRLT